MARLEMTDTTGFHFSLQRQGLPRAKRKIMSLPLARAGEGEHEEPMACMSSSCYLLAQTTFISYGGLRPPPASSPKVLGFSEAPLLRREKEVLDFPP